MEVQNLEDEFVSLGRGEPEENDMLSTSSEILDPCATIVEEYVRAERRSLNPEDENEAHTASALLSSPSGDGVDVKQKSEEGCSENDFPAVSEDETMVTSSTELHSLANNVSGKIEPCSDIDAAEERAKEEMIMLLMRDYGHWENVLLTIRNYLVWNSVKAGCISSVIIIVLNIVLWYGAVILEKLGIVTALSLIGIIITLTSYVLQLIGIKARNLLPAPSQNSYIDVDDKEVNGRFSTQQDDLSMEDLIKLYVQFVFQAKKIQVNVSQKISSGDKLKGKVVLAIVLALTFVGLLGQVLSGFFILWMCIFSILMAPPILGNGLHRPVQAKLMPHAERVMNFIDEQLDESHSGKQD